MDDAEKGRLRQRLEHYLKRLLSHVPPVVAVVIAALWRGSLTTPEDSSAPAERGPTVESMARGAAETAGFAVTPGAKSDTAFEPEPAATPQPVTETEMRGRREMLEVFRADSEAQMLPSRFASARCTLASRRCSGLNSYSRSSPVFWRLLALC